MAQFFNNDTGQWEDDGNVPINADDPNGPQTQPPVDPTPAAPTPSAPTATAPPPPPTAGEINTDNITAPSLVKGGEYKPEHIQPGAGTQLTAPKIGTTASALEAQQVQAQTVNAPQAKAAAKYDANQVADADVVQGQAAQGTVSSQAQVTAQQGNANNSNNVLDSFNSWASTQQVDPSATVQGQYAKLMDFEPGQVPAWAKGAMTTAAQAMAARGIPASTMAGEAITASLMQAALPIASQDAQIFQTMQLKKLDAVQQSTFLKAGYLAQMDITNLNNRQQAAVTNAQSFLQMDVSNLDARQQSAIINTQSRVQTMLSNQAAKNAAMQFNATSDNQTNQFYDNLSSTVQQFNAAQTNTMGQFNTNQSNAMAQFNKTQNDLRDQFNVKNQMMVDQSNATYLRNINTANTAADNQANLVNSQNIMEISNTAMANGIQMQRDHESFIFQASENALDRANNRTLVGLNRDANLSLQKSVQKANLWSALGSTAANVFGSWATSAGNSSGAGDDYTDSSTINADSQNTANNWYTGVDTSGSH